MLIQTVGQLTSYDDPVLTLDMFNWYTRTVELLLDEEGITDAQIKLDRFDYYSFKNYFFYQMYQKQIFLYQKTQDFKGTNNRKLILKSCHKKFRQNLFW